MRLSRPPLIERCSADRVDLLVASLDGGGAERVMVDLANALSDAVGQVRLVVIGRASGPYRTEISASVRLIELGSKHVRHSIPQLIQTFREDPPQGILSTQVHVNIAAIVARQLGCPNARLVIREGTTPGSIGLRFWNGVWGRMLRLPYRFADVVVAPSSGIGQCLMTRAFVPRRSLQVIPNPISVKDLRQRAGLPSDFELPRGERYIVAMGRLSVEKGFEDLIRAFAIVCRLHEVRLVVLGEGPERPRLSTLITHLGLSKAVSMPGFLANPFPILAGASAFVLSSHREGLPNALLQALALDVPCIATDCRSGPREIFSAVGAGELVAVGDIYALSNAIARALRSKGQARTSVRIASEFDVSMVASRYRSLLRSNDSSKPCERMPST